MKTNILLVITAIILFIGSLIFLGIELRELNREINAVMRLDCVKTETHAVELNGQLRDYLFCTNPDKYIIKEYPIGYDEEKDIYGNIIIGR